MDISRPFGNSVNKYISETDYTLQYCSVLRQLHRERTKAPYADGRARFNARISSKYGAPCGPAALGV